MVPSMPMTADPTDHVRRRALRAGLIVAVLSVFLSLVGPGPTGAADIGRPPCHPVPVPVAAEGADAAADETAGAAGAAGAVADEAGTDGVTSALSDGADPLPTAPTIEASTTAGTSHATHADGGGCCPTGACGGACDGACPGAGAGPCSVGEAFRASNGTRSPGGLRAGEPLLAGALGAPFRPPIERATTAA